MFTNYYEVRDWLESFIPLVYGKEELGLTRIRYLLKLLGNPHKKFKSIHVAGTSGKGSTAYYTAKLLEVSQVSKVSKGLKIGLHVSPHLVDIRERMQIFLPPPSFSRKRESGFPIKSGMTAEGGSLMPMGRFLRLFNEMRPVVEKIQKEKPELTPSYFEILVAASFLYFTQEKVDWAVVEVGLGGRLDATNVLMPEVSVITNIGLDHTDILGKTVEKIAFEKAGIIKKGVPVVTGCPSTLLRQAQDRSGSSAPHTSRGAFEVIADVAKKRQAPLITIDTQDKQLANELLAIAAVNLVTGQNPVSQGSALTKVGLPGRFEEIEPDVILDGAHNPDKIKYLLDLVISINEVILVVGFKKGKDWRKMVDLLFQNLDIERCIATQFYSVTDTGKFAAVEPEEIARYVKSVYGLTTTVYSNSQEAVFEAIESAHNYSSSGAERSREVNGKFSTGSNNNLVFVTGSLYLVGEVRTMWKLPSF